MKHQQVVVDYWNMIKASFTCLLLAFSGYILIKMVQTIFWLPAYLQKNQKRLEELAAQYSLDLNEDRSITSDSKEEKDVGESQPILQEQSVANEGGSADTHPCLVQEPKKYK